MHQALYRKWRPKTFDDFYGQEHITSVLKYEAEHSQFNHAYLFCGSRGTGKTTCAKILAKVVNCENPVGGNPCGCCPACLSIENGTATDVVEMDAASNNGVDNIRDIRDEVVYSPSNLKYRVYIIDEVHMLSGSAFNALLKTLEEPPAHVVFILATTEMQKLPATIISRCQRFDFRRIAVPELMKRLQVIAAAEGIDLTEDGARMLARLAQGGMRDAISLLELCAGSRKKIDPDTVNEMVGVSSRESLYKVVGAVAAKDYDTIFDVIASVVNSAKDVTVFWQDLISLYRDMLVVSTTKNADRYLDLTEVESQTLKQLTAQFTKEKLLYHCSVLDNALTSMQKTASVRRSIAELALLQMCDPVLNHSNEALAARISDLENRMWSGAVPAQAEVRKEAVRTETPRPAATAPAAGSADPTRRVLKPIKGWGEVLARIKQSAPDISSFLTGARGYLLETGDVLVKLDSEFAKTMVTRRNGQELILGAVGAELQTDISHSALLFEVSQAEETNDILDEILETGNE